MLFWALLKEPLGEQQYMVQVTGGLQVGTHRGEKLNWLSLKEGRCWVHCLLHCVGHTFATSRLANCAQASVSRRCVLIVYKVL